jgi:hypothetical protein
MSDSKIDIYPMVRLARDQIAIPIDVPNTRRDPLVISAIPVHDRPHILGRKLPDNLKIIPESLKANASPNVEMRLGMTIGFEIFEKCVFVQNAWVRQDVSPQLLSTNCSAR